MRRLNRIAIKEPEELFTVAIIGADGAGKSTVTRRLVDTLPLPVKYVYMGVNLETSNLMLPTTRLWLEIKRARGKRPDMVGPLNPALQKPLPKSRLKRLLGEIKTTARIASLSSEEWFRQCVVWFFLRKGYIVIFDRHFFFDYYFHHISHEQANLPLSQRLHGIILNRFYPKPDFVICLDAPAEVLYGRKAEASVDVLETRRQEYLHLQNVVKDFYCIDATQPLDSVVQEAGNLIIEFYKSKTKDSGPTLDKVRPIPRGSSK
jgi:thymidylate kinase